MRLLLLGLAIVSQAGALSVEKRVKRDGKADLSGAPRIISEVGSSSQGEIKALEPPADHKGAATAIIVIFAFIFAVAGVFIGVYFRFVNKYSSYPQLEELQS